MKRIFGVMLCILLGGCVASKKPYASLVLHFKTEQSSENILATLEKAIGDIGYVRADKNSHESTLSGASTTYFFQRKGVQCIFTLPTNRSTGEVGITLYPSRSDGEQSFVADGEKLRDNLRASSLPIKRIEFDVRK